jgi:Holliday junction resolvasome RuvABC endonuclease subunit
MCFAGFDLGGKTGYALLNSNGKLERSGTLVLGKRCPSSIEKLYEFLDNFLEETVFVCYEKVSFFSKGTKAAHAYGSYEAILWHACTKYDVEPEMIHVATLKKNTMGSGRATKEDMETFVFSKFGYVPYDDNEADAICIAYHLFTKYDG